MDPRSPEEEVSDGRWWVYYQHGPCEAPLLVNHERRLVVWVGDEGFGALQLISEFYDLLDQFGWVSLEEL